MTDSPAAPSSIEARLDAALEMISEMFAELVAEAKAMPRGPWTIENTLRFARMVQALAAAGATLRRFLAPKAKAARTKGERFIDMTEQLDLIRSTHIPRT